MRQRTGRIAGDATIEVARTDDGGFTIVEVVMTIVLIALTILPILDATFTSIRASTTVREVAEVETVLQNAADRVNRAPTLCDYTQYIQAAALSTGWQATQVTATYQYYVPGSSALKATPGHWENNGCPGSPPMRTPRLIQKVTVTVRSESGTINRSIQVVKSDV